MLNLFDILLENIDCERLIEEGKDPVQVLHYKFQNVPSDIIDSIIAIDPTKKKSYSQWILSKWDNEQSIITNALQDGRLEKLFQFFREHQEKQIKDCPSVSEGLDAYVPKVEDTVLGKSSEPETYVLMIGDYVDSELANDFDIVFNKDNWLIAVPNTYEASCKLGENCWWCTANHYGNGESYYREYLREGGKYYINFDLSKGETLDDKTRKEYPYTRYQFHFESRQFKAATQGEPDVTLEDLNIPESAIDFYHEIDKSYDIGEKSLEEQMYEYEDQRYSDAIRLNDDLYLNVEYNDNYVYEEPTLNDYWYVFDNEDDRDPISWDEVNPEAIKVNNDSLIIIERRNNSEKFLVIVKGASESRWRDWGAESVDKYVLIDGYDNALFGLIDGNYNDNPQIMLAAANEEFLYLDAYEKVNDIFLNTNVKDNICNSEGVLEVVLEDGYHSLIYWDGINDIDYIIKKDIPINGKFFEVEYSGDQTFIHGEFKTYDVDNLFDDEYRLERKLNSGDYLVAREERGEDRHGNYKKQTRFNILNAQTRELFFNTWADSVYETPTGYIVTFNGKKTMFDFNGKPLIEGDYQQLTRLTEDSDIIVGVKPNDKGYDLIDGSDGQIFAQFASIDLSHKPQNNRIIVKVYVPEIVYNAPRIYDYAERRFVDERYTSLYPMPCGLILASLPDNYGYEIINYGTGQVVIDKIVNYKVKKFNRIILYTLNNGKSNCINFETGKIMIPVNFDEFIEMATNIIEYKNNGKYFFYDYENKKPILREDGIDYEGNVDYRCMITFDAPTNYHVTYNYEINKFFYFGRDNYNRQFDANAPQEVVNFVNYLQGNDSLQQVPSQQEEVPSMAENFNRMLNRINEARKLNRREIYN